MPQRRDGAKAGDDDAVHVSHDFFLSTSFWIALTTSPTVVEFGARIIGVGVVGDLDVELLFEIENHLDGIERFETQVLEPVGQLDRSAIVDPHLLGDDGNHVVRYVGH